MKQGTQEFNAPYKSRSNLSKDLVGKEAVDTLFYESKFGKDSDIIGKEVRFDMVSNTEHMYDASYIPRNSDVEIPSTEGFNMTALSGNVKSLESQLNSIANVTNRPEVIRVIASPNKDAYAIFTK
ncbi:MAG: hypothetical protein WC758_04970 [Candidatus Woesearchaeota archaeon]|jgi:hypothetical protein